MNKSKRIKNILFWRTYCLFNFLDNLNNIKFKYSDILKIWIEYDRLIYNFINNWFFMIFYIIFFFKKHIYGFNIYYMIKYLCNSIPGENYKKIFKKNITKKIVLAIFQRIFKIKLFWNIISSSYINIIINFLIIFKYLQTVMKSHHILPTYFLKIEGLNLHKKCIFIFINKYKMLWQNIYPNPSANSFFISSEKT